MSEVAATVAAPENVPDPTAASQGVAALPDVNAASQAATATVIHSVTGAIMRRNMRLVDIFDKAANLDALLDFLTGINNFLVVSRLDAKDVDIEVSSIMPLSGGDGRIVTTLKKREDDVECDLCGTTFDANSEQARIVTTLRRR